MISNIQLSDSQYEFIYDERQDVLFCGGLGSGKTFAGAIWALKMILEFPTVNGIITANSYSQLTKATLASLFKLLDQLKIKYSYKVNSHTLHVNGTIVNCYSVENEELLRGVEAGWCWSDECSFYAKSAFDRLRPRIRDKRGPCQWKGTTTPNGYNWLYEYFVQNAMPYKSVHYAKTLDNAVNLPDSYVRNLKDQFDSKLAQQELDGAFVNLTAGNVYHAFDRNRAVRPGTLMPNDHLILGLDFNVHPLCGVFAVQRGNGIHIVDELYLENSNTFDAVKEIIKRYPNRQISVIADETGNRRKSSSMFTDHEIIRRAGFNLIPFKNPAVKDRYNNTNRLLENEYIKIAPSCKKVIKDLEMMTYSNDDEMLGHISDALGYVLWKFNPLVKPQRSASISYY
jgi:PBSX family phage terminase large subunit